MANARDVVKLILARGVVRHNLTVNRVMDDLRNAVVLGEEAGVDTWWELREVGDMRCAEDCEGFVGVDCAGECRRVPSAEGDDEIFLYIVARNVTVHSSGRIGELNAASVRERETRQQHVAPS